MHPLTTMDPFPTLSNIKWISHFSPENNYSTNPVLLSSMTKTNNSISEESTKKWGMVME